MTRARKWEMEWRGLMALNWDSMLRELGSMGASQLRVGLSSHSTGADMDGLDWDVNPS